MKMFKKIMAVALTAVMAVSMLTGCAVSDAIAEKQAEKALENAYKTVAGENVNFKSFSVDSSVTSPVKTEIKNGTILLADDETYAETVTVDGKEYTVVVVTEPKSATKLGNWKNVAVRVLTAAYGENDIWLEGTTNKTAKVAITAGLEGKNATDTTKSDTYAMFVFAANEAAYDKK